MSQDFQACWVPDKNKDKRFLSDKNKDKNSIVNECKRN